MAYYYNYKVVRNLLTNETYVLTTCGEPPAPASVPAGAKYFNVPLVNVTVTDTTVIAYMEKLGLRGDIRYADLAYAVNPCLHAAKAAGTLEQVEASPDAYYNPGNEEIYSAQLATVDALLSGIADPAQPKAISFSASADPGPLHRSEWLQFLGLFWNKEAEAEAAFSEIATRYSCTKAAVAASVPAEARPGIAFINHDTYAQPAEFQVSVADYKEALIADAGGRNVNTDGVTVANSAFSGARSHVGFLTSAEMWEYLAANDVSVLIDEYYAFDPTAYNITNFLETYNVTDGVLPAGVQKVLREDGLLSASNSMDWFEGAVPFADATLQDLVGAIYGRTEGGPAQLWFRDLTGGAQPKKLSLADCPSVEGYSWALQPNPWTDPSRSCENLGIAFPSPAPSPAPSLPAEPTDGDSRAAEDGEEDKDAADAASAAPALAGSCIAVAAAAATVAALI